LSDVVRTVHVAVSDHSTPTALPQPAFDTTITVLMSTDTTRRRRSPFIWHLDFDTTFTSLVVEQVHQRIETHSDRLEAAEEQLAALGDVGTAKTTKEQKLAAIIHFATNKRGTQSQAVAVTADEIQGCVGVSRR
jgi:hypothetical protein